jgi:NitT/TauT family transport system substrate-binding protein/sulfonate transport system substrate-binding protein
LIDTTREERMKLMSMAAGIVAGWIAATSGAFAQDSIDIKIGAATASDHAPAFAALEKGFFAKHGLNAKIIMYPSGVEMINGLLGGQQSVNVMGSIPFLAGVANGLPLVLIGHLHADPTKDSYSTGHSIVVGPGTGIKSIADLKGKKIGLPRGTGAEGYLTGLLQANGLTPANVTLVNVKPEDLPAALAQKNVDAFAVWEPWPSTAIVKVPGSERLISGGCPTCYIPAAFLTSKSVVASNPEALRRFMAAISEAEQWVRQNPDEAAEINMHWISGIDLPIMKQAVRQANFDPRMSKTTALGYNKITIPSLVAGGGLKKAVDPSPNIDAEFILGVEKDHPEYFSDLPPIPAELKLN